MKYLFLIAICFLTLSCQKESGFANQKGISDADYNELITLSDTSNMVSGEDVKYKLDRITQILSGYNDNRGLFPLIYAQTTKQALLSINNEPEKYEVLANATAITLAFAKRYLFNLHDHLLGKRSPEYHWKQYYVLCFSNNPRLRMAAAGLNAHLTVDLARAIADIGGRQSYKNDFLQFGEALVEATPDIIADLEDLYAVESEELFNGFFLEDIVDPIFGEGATTQFAFQFIRQEAFSNAQLLQGPRPDNAQQHLFVLWRDREKLLDDLVESGFIE
jgi:Family of unknown function (DUF5995)